MSLASGTTLGSYQVLRAIGAGGMGEVYLARDGRLGREVAIKVLPEAVAGDADRLARFEREARVLASLNHPNIATLFGFETARPEVAATMAPGIRLAPAPLVHLLVMELVPGETLADRIGRGALPLEEALPIFLQIAEGLEAAHERGVIHRDLKPANVKISPQGVVKVLDFGLAKALVEDSATSNPSYANSPTLTLAATIRGEILGTAAYMAPEQARGQPLDRRADVWAFGACLFEALTGRSVFGGETVTDTLALVLQGKPDWDALPPRTPRVLVDLLRRCLEKSTKERLRDIGEARITIGKLLADGWEREPTVETPAMVARSWRVPAIAAAAVGLLIGAIVGWIAAERRSPPTAAVTHPAIRFTMSMPSGEAFSEITDLAISPDGRRVVYRLGADASYGGNAPERRLYVRSLDAFDAQAKEIPGTEGAQYPFFSPDGEWVGFFLGPGGQRTLSKVHLDRATVVAITREPHPGYRASWGASGEILLGNQRGGPLRVVSSSGAVAPLELAGEEGGGTVSYLHPHVLPDGKSVLFTRLGAADSDPEVALVDLSTGEQRTILEGGSDGRYAAGPPQDVAAKSSDYLLYGYRGELRAIRFDLGQREVVGDPLPVVPRVRMDAFGGAFFALAGDGTLVYLPGEAEESRGSALVWVDRTGDVVEELAVGTFASPTVSRDGRRIAVMRFGAKPGLFVIERGGAAMRVAGMELRPEFPAWSPDGTTLYFGTGIPGSPVVHRVLADGALRKPESVFDAAQVAMGPHPGGQHPGSISPDGGEMLISQIDQMGHQNVVGGALDGTKTIRQLVATEFNENEPEVSPRGDLLAYVSDRDGENRVYVTSYPQPGRHVPVTADASTIPRWSSDGNELFYMAERHLWSARIEAEPELRIVRPTRLFETDNVDLGRGYDVAPDGRFLVIRPVGQAAAERDVQGGRLHVALGLFDELERATPGAR